MKVIIISPHPSFGGSSTANQNIAKSIACAGHDVIYMDEYYPEELKSKAGLNIDSYPVHRNKVLKQFATYRYLRSLEPDAIIFGVPIIGVFMWLAALLLRIRGIKTCCIFHSLSLSKSLSGRMTDALISCFASTCSKLFFVSDYTLVSWMKFWPLKFKKKSAYVIFNPIEMKPGTKSSNTPTPFIVGFVGRFSNEKQPLLFCETAKALSNNTNIRFVAFGDGPLLEECKEKYSVNVEFKGYSNDIDKIYKDMSILLMTSEFENCPMAILESAARGIPAIAPKVGGIPEIVKPGYNGELFIEYSTESITKEIEKITGSYSAYSQNAFNEARSFTIETISAKWDKTLKN